MTAVSSLHSPIARAELRRAGLLLTGGGLLFGIALTVGGLLLRGLAITPAVLAREVLAWLTICGTVPVIMLFAEHMQRRRAGWLQAIAFHLPAFLAVVSAHALVYNAVLILTFGSTVPWMAAAVNLARYDALIYPLVVVAVSMTRQRRVTRRSELASARIARRVAQAELDQLRVQLDPDEIIAELAEIERAMTSDAAEAEERLHALSRSLRRKLDRIATPERTLPRRTRAVQSPSSVGRAVILIASAFGLYLTAIMVSLRLVNGASTWRDLFGMLIAFALTGLCTAAAIPLVRRFLSWRARTLVRRLAGFVGFLLFCVTQAVVVELLMAFLRRYEMGRPLGWMLDFVLLLSMVMLYVVAYDDLKLLQRESRLDAERLASALTEARLRSLRTQIAPHFLFNTLNSVMSLMRSDVPGARQMLVRLRALMRVAADHREQQEVPLSEDLEMTRSYLDIEKVRFRDAIDVDVDVDETLLDAYVPSFLLQPLVENAVRHGALASLGRGTVRVIVARDGPAAMTLTIRNDGELLDPSGWREGIGLSSTRARLSQMYGPAHELSIAASEATGVSVSVRIPVRLAGGGSLRRP
jgi:hypothetical protein